MTTFSIIAIPFFALAVTMLVLAITKKKPVFFILGGVFMSSAVVNAVIGYSVSP